MTLAFTVFAKAAVRRQGIPFEVVIYVPNAEKIAAIQEAHKMNKDPSSGKRYTDVDAMMKGLPSRNM